jgi:raffinose/stachyose/melibiose transport system substrate-binding protein
MMATEKIRLFGLFVHAIVFVGVLAGCMSGDFLHIEEPEKTTLTFRHFWIREHDRPVERIIADVIAEFERDHPQVKIDFEGMDQTIHREQKLKSEMVTGNPPDIIALFGGAEIEPYVHAERLVDLSGFLQENGLEQSFKDLSLWTFDGGVYGLPLEGHAEPLFYNRDLFERFGLEPPRTFPELMKITETFNQNGIVPFALGNDELWQGAVYYHYFLHRFGGPQRIEAIASGTGTFVNPDYIRAAETFTRFIEASPFPIDVNKQDRDYAIRLFTSEKAAMYLNGNWDITLFKTGPEGERFSDKIGVVNFVPDLAGSDGSQALAGGYTLGLGISAGVNEKQKEAALALFERIYRPEVQQRLVYEAMRIPSMDIAFDEKGADPVFAQVTALLEETQETFIPYDNILPPEVKQQFLRSIRQVIAREKREGEELLDMQEVSERYWKLRESVDEPDELDKFMR